MQPLDYIILFIFILVVILLAWVFIMEKIWIFTGKVRITPLGLINEMKRKKKEGAKNKIMGLFKKLEKITNTDVEKLLSISDATVTRYLEELEKEGKIAQQGETGKWVFYTRV